MGRGATKSSFRVMLDRADVEAAALRLESVTRAVDGRPIKKVIVVPERIVNVVA